MILRKRLLIIMQAIRLKVYQQTANYRVPVSHEFRESYPLPPYSTVIGMVHYLCNFTKYHPINISIQGSSNSTTSDFFTRYEFKSGMKFEPSRHQLNAEGFGISRGIGYTQLLVDVNLILHIIPQDQSEIQMIYEGLRHPREYPSIGRREDLAVFESVKIVNVERQKLEDGDYDIQYASYIPQSVIDQNIINLKDSNGGSLKRGTIYKLNKDYRLVQTRKGKFERRWNKIPTIYLSNYQILEGKECLFDSDGYPVFI